MEKLGKTQQNSVNPLNPEKRLKSVKPSKTTSNRFKSSKMMKHILKIIN